MHKLLHLNEDNKDNFDKINYFKFNLELLKTILINFILTTIFLLIYLKYFAFRFKYLLYITYYLWTKNLYKIILQYLLK